MHSDDLIIRRLQEYISIKETMQPNATYKKAIDYLITIANEMKMTHEVIEVLLFSFVK